MDENLIQIREHTEDNYRPVIRFGAWRVAVLNSHSRFYRPNITQLERHLLTDETFTLLKGRAALYVAAGGETITGPIEVVELEPFKVYNVRRGVWHAVETEANTSILITENDDTSPQNTPKMPISPKDLPAWQKRKPT